MRFRYAWRFINQSINQSLNQSLDDAAITLDGTDSYGGLKEVNKLKFFKRTECVSTTNLIDRILAPVGDRANMYPADTVYMNGMLANFIKSSPNVTVVLKSASTAQLEAQEKLAYFRASWDMFSKFDRQSIN